MISLRQWFARCSIAQLNRSVDARAMVFFGAAAAGSESSIRGKRHRLRPGLGDVRESVALLPSRGPSFKFQSASVAPDVNKTLPSAASEIVRTEP